MDQGIQFQLQWVGDTFSAPSPVNQAMVIADVPANGESKPETHIVVLGFVTPPMILPDMTPDDLAALAAQPLPVVPHGRFLFSAGKLRELRDQITEHLAKLEQR